MVLKWNMNDSQAQLQLQLQFQLELSIALITFFSDPPITNQEQ